MPQDPMDPLITLLRKLRDDHARRGDHSAALITNDSIRYLKGMDPLMPEPHQTHEYWITLNFQVQAHDEEEALTIAKDLLAHGTAGTAYRVVGEVSQIEKAT